MHRAAFRFAVGDTLRPIGYNDSLTTVANGNPINLVKTNSSSRWILFLYLPNPNSLIIDRNNTYWIGTYRIPGSVHYDPRTQWLERFDSGGGLIETTA